MSRTCTSLFVAVHRHSHLVSDTLYGVSPYPTPTLSLLEWVASNTRGTVR